MQSVHFLFPFPYTICIYHDYIIFVFKLVLYVVYVQSMHKLCTNYAQLCTNYAHKILRTKEDKKIIRFMFEIHFNFISFRYSICWSIENNL